MKKLLSLLFLAILPLIASANTAKDKIDGIYYIFNLSEKTAKVTESPVKYKGSIDIPDVVIYNDVPYVVTSIGDDAFYWCTELTSVTIPNSVISISSWAFYCCKGLTSVTIPNSVTSIGSEAFLGCSGLTTVTIPNSVKSINYKTFYNCSGLTSVIIPSSVTSIGQDAFYGCNNLVTITIPNSVTSIKKYAFQNCSSLTTVTIPNSLKSIETYAFDGCSSLSSVHISDLEAWCKIKFDGARSNPLFYAHNLYINEKKVMDLEIPNSITYLNDFVFCGCSSLTSVIIPNNNVTTIGKDAFANCSGITSFLIPNSVTTIKDEAFWGCSGLTAIIIPYSVKSIGKRAFAYCNGLNSIVVESDNPNYDSRDNCNAIITNSNTLIVGCKNSKIVDSVTNIGNYAFSGCDGLTYITIPNNVTSIGDNAFKDCSGLTSLTLPNNLTDIGGGAFSECSGLRFVIALAETPLVPPSLYNNSFSNYEIPLYVPKGCVEIYKATEPWSNFKEVLPIEEGILYTLTYMVDGEVYKTYQMREGEAITPEAEPTKDGYTFSGWSDIPPQMPAYDVTVTGTFTEKPLTIGDTFTAKTKEGAVMTFKVTSLDPMTCQVGDGEIASIDDATEGIVTIPEVAKGFKVTAIGAKGFYNCAKLTTIWLNENIESIGELTFYGCTSLKTLDIPRSVKTIGNSAFDNCGGTGGVTINVDVDMISVIPNNDKIKVNVKKPSKDDDNDVVKVLEKVFIPKSVVSIGERSFSNCESVKKMVVEEGHSVYDSRENCNAIIETATNTLLFGCQNTIIPATVTSIEAYAFEGHTNLKSIKLPADVAQIGGCAFSGCESLTVVVSMIETPFAINDNTFDDYTYQNATLTVPFGTKDAYRDTDGWKNFYNIVESDGSTVEEEVVKEWRTKVEDIVGEIMEDSSDGSYSETNDINNDGVVNVADIVSLTNDLLLGENGKDNPEEDQGTVIYQSTEGELIYCNGIYPFEETLPDAEYFSTELIGFNRSHFKISFDFTAESVGQVLMLSADARVLGLHIEDDMKIGISINNQDYIFTTSQVCELNKSCHVTVVYNNGSLKVNGEEFDVVLGLGDDTLISTNFATGSTFKGWLKNIVVTSYDNEIK